MDEQQIRRIIREVLQRVVDEGAPVSPADSSPLPKAYFIFPKNWQSCESSEYLPALKSVEGKYQRVIVLPERDANEERFSEVGACTVVSYSDLCAPAEGSVTIFPIPCRYLIIKTALCLSEDFEGYWVRKCIENGLRVSMKQERPMFTGKEPAAYRKKILSYYQDVKSYGICLAEADDPCVSVQKDVQLKAKIQARAKYITTQDLRDVPRGGTFSIHSGDVLTALAKEHAEKYDIRIVEE